MSIKGAIFDADGTILDSMGIWYDLGLRYLGQLNITPEPGLAEELVPLSLEEGCLLLNNRYNLHKSISEIKSGISGIISDFYKHEVLLKEGVHIFLESLSSRNIPMIVATAGDCDLTYAALKRLGVCGFFDDILTCDMMKTSKNDPLIYLRAAEHIGTKPNETYVFEDSLLAVETAKLAGFRTVAVNDKYNTAYLRELLDKSDFFISDFEDFQSFWDFAIKS